MTDVQALVLKWCNEERGRLQTQIGAMEAGLIRILAGENDLTAGALLTAKQRLQELDDILSQQPPP